MFTTTTRRINNQDWELKFTSSDKSQVQDKADNFRCIFRRGARVLKSGNEFGLFVEPETVTDYYEIKMITYPDGTFEVVEAYYEGEENKDGDRLFQIRQGEHEDDEMDVVTESEVIAEMTETARTLLAYQIQNLKEDYEYFGKEITYGFSFADYRNYLIDQYNQLGEEWVESGEIEYPQETEDKPQTNIYATMGYKAYYALSAEERSQIKVMALVPDCDLSDML